MKKKTACPSLHLLSNAHLDPVWLWEWEEGAAEALATFRSAADLCEQFDTFIFNHNEVILYEWIEDYDPALFERIRRLVKAGRWHIMGGWFLQPDCNMPSGESFVRQVLLGRTYFREKFGVSPRVAINVDPFGHTRGLVQIMARAGFEGYLFGRPGPEDCDLPAEQFTWVGYDGSSVIATRFRHGYNNLLGCAGEKLKRVLDEKGRPDCCPMLWGVGNHGGGPSRRDIRDLNRAIREHAGSIRILHSTPERYLSDVKRTGQRLPQHKGDLNPWGVGCYTSQVRIKQKHRELENQLFMTEKMACAAWLNGVSDYPGDALASAGHDLATSQFHDILPGSAIPTVEDASLRLLDHGLETLSRIRAKLFFALSAGLKPASLTRLPVEVYNPHPYAVRTTIACEVQLPDQNWASDFTTLHVMKEGKELPAQIEKELSNLNLDWRKRIVFNAELAPSSMNRFDCIPEKVPAKSTPSLKPRNGQLRFRTRDIDVIINTRTGLLDRYRVDGKDYLAKGACRPLVVEDDADPWGSRVRRFQNRAQSFKRLSPQACARASGVTAATLTPVRVVEEGPVRTVVEACFGFNRSLLIVRYLLPAAGARLEIELRVQWMERDRMLKLVLPTVFGSAAYVGQVAYGRDHLPANGDEAVAQQWTAVVDNGAGRALTVINEGCYGSDFRDGRLRLSLLRSSAYSCLPIGDRDLLVQDRYSARIDQGERHFRFWLQGGTRSERLSAVDREALVLNEKPMALSFCPSGQGRKPKPLVTLSDRVVQLTAAKRSEDGRALIVRLFEPTGRARATTVAIPVLATKRKVRLGAFEIKTLRVDLKRRTWCEADLMEKKLK